MLVERVGGANIVVGHAAGWSRPPYEPALYIALHNDSASRISSLYPPIPAVRRTSLEASWSIG
jgi:hypothetical protein